MMKLKRFVSVLVIFIALLGCLICLNKTSQETIKIVKKENLTDWIPVSEVNISNVTKDIIGYISIPKFNKEYYTNMPIKEGTSLDVLATAIGHFENTPYLEGNVCIVAHNSGINKNGDYVGYFDRIDELKYGDKIIYNNLKCEYEYEVISNEIIEETNLEVLNNTEENRLTLITCVKGQENREYRRCVKCTKI